MAFDFVENFTSSVEFKNGYTLSAAKGEKEGEGSGEVTTIEDEGSNQPEEILRDLGMWSRAGGFDEFDKYSSI